jgi:hypothetical protein
MRFRRRIAPIALGIAAMIACGGRAGHHGGSDDPANAVSESGAAGRSLVADSGSLDAASVVEAGDSGGASSAGGGGISGQAGGSGGSAGEGGADGCRYEVMAPIALDWGVNAVSGPPSDEGYPALWVEPTSVSAPDGSYALELEILDSSGHVARRASPALGLQAQPGQSTASISASAVAPFAGGYFAVWHVYRSGAPGPLQGVLLDAAGAPRTDPFDINEPTTNAAAMLLAADDRIGVVWPSPDGYVYVPFGPDGARLGSNVVFASPKLPVGFTGLWDQDHFDVFWADDLPALAEVRAISIDGNGVPLTESLLFSDPDTYGVLHAVAATDSGYLMAWEERARTADATDRQRIALLDRDLAERSAWETDTPIYRLASTGTEFGAIAYVGDAWVFTRVGFDGKLAGPLLPLPDIGSEYDLQTLYWHKTGFGLSYACSSGPARRCYLEIRCQ